MSNYKIRKFIQLLIKIIITRYKHKTINLKLTIKKFQNSCNEIYNNNIILFNKYLYLFLYLIKITNKIMNINNFFLLINYYLYLKFYFRTLIY